MKKSKLLFVSSFAAISGLVAFSLQTAFALYKNVPEDIVMKVGLAAPTTAEITFQCQKDVGYGNKLQIAGTFNSWSLVDMTWTSNNVWEYKTTIDIGTTIQYKRVIYYSGGSTEWESCNNHEYTVTATATVNVGWNVS